MLELVWSRGNVTVRELLVECDLRQAYTTIMTTLDRLFKKGVLDRRTDGKAFRYSARCSPQEVPRLVAVKALERWIASRQGSSILHLSYFVEAIGAHDVRLLDELRDLVERKRQELKEQGRIDGITCPKHRLQARDLATSPSVPAKFCVESNLLRANARPRK